MGSSEGVLEPRKKSRTRVLVLVILGGVVILGFAGFLIVREHLRGIVTEGRRTWQEAQSLGRSLTAAACVDSAFARQARLEDPSFGTLVGERLFLDGCLRTSQPAPEVCSDAPPAREIARSVAWMIEVCRVRATTAGRNCVSLLQPLLEYCDRRAGRAQ